MKKNEDIIRSFFYDQQNEKKKELAEKIWAKDVIIHEGDVTVIGRDHLEKMIEQRRNAVPDLRYEVDDIITSGDKVAVRWHGIGTAVKEIAGMKPSDKPFKYWGISIMVVRDGQIIENWESTSLADIPRPPKL